MTDACRLSGPIAPLAATRTPVPFVHAPLVKSLLHSRKLVRGALEVRRFVCEVRSRRKVFQAALQLELRRAAVADAEAHPAALHARIAGGVVLRVREEERIVPAEVRADEASAALDIRPAGTSGGTPPWRL